MENRFVLKIADCPFAVNALFASTKKFCEDYLTDERPSEEITVFPEDLLEERARSDAERAFEGRAPAAFPDAYLETLAVYRKLAERLPFRDRCVFHGSAIAMDGEGYIFTAKSGTGKSTHARLWRETFGERTVMVNDDKPVIGFREGRAFVYGTPWNGKHALGKNIAVPLKSICVIRRDRENRLERITPEEMYPLLLRQIYRPDDAEGLVRTLDFLDRLETAFSCFRLSCNMEKEAAVTAYEGMNQK